MTDKQPINNQYITNNSASFDKQQWVFYCAWRQRRRPLPTHPCGGRGRGCLGPGCISSSHCFLGGISGGI